MASITRMKRFTWFVGGAVVGAVGVETAKRKVKATAASLSPATLARRAGEGLRDRAADAGRSLRARERAFVARRRGQVSSLADELDGVDSVLVDGREVDADKVVVLRQASTSRTRRGA